MGYPMAVNLRSKLGPEYTVLICDVNKAAIEKYKQQTQGKGPVGVVANGAEAVRASVSANFYIG